ncbi:MAG: leucine-rich repeat domain-containing protein [Clostridia bacterium]|nr:leucine-rich repeat domain-containing protein [Clostridia bacterium]
MKKLLISILLILTFACVFVGCNSQGSDNSNIGTEGLVYYPLNDGTYAVGGGEAKYLSNIIIPATYSNKPVTKIADNAFSNFEFSSITLPNSITSIGDSAFFNCDNIDNITLPNNIVEIGDSAFASCNQLTNINIPTGVKNIANYIFFDCSKLANISILGNIENIGEFAFSECTSLVNLNIPDCVKDIGNSAFYNCNKLETFELPNQLLNIGNSSFYNCIKISTLTIPSSVTQIGAFAFYNCLNLSQINYNAVECLDSTEDSAIFFGVGRASGGVVLTVSENVKKIPAYLFYSGKRDEAPIIKNIIFKEDGICTSIGTRAFSLVRGFDKIKIPDSVIQIGNYAFTFCPNLNNVEIGNGTKSIGVQAFSGCSNLTEIVLGQSVESISYQAFSGCSNLAKAIFKNTNGWTVAPVLSSGHAISSEQLSDTSKAAAYLRTTYETYNWKRI